VALAWPGRSCRPPEPPPGADPGRRQQHARVAQALGAPLGFPQQAAGTILGPAQRRPETQRALQGHRQVDAGNGREAP
jgi:hypothetical protein